jgi:hypothetical protein
MIKQFLEELESKVFKLAFNTPLELFFIGKHLLAQVNPFSKLLNLLTIINLMNHMENIE